MVVAEVEVLQVFEVAQLAAADGVQLVFHLGGELVVDQVRQMGLEQLGDGKGGPGGHQHVAALDLNTYSRARMVSMIEA